MKARSVLALIGAIILAAGVMTSFAAGKKCGKLCKTDIATCRTNVGTPASCTGETKEEKRACKSARKIARKQCRTSFIASCKLPTAPPDACSPSGAFIDAALDTL
jgi:hypothetical protein